MTMPSNGKPVPIQRGQHVQPGPMSFEVTAGYGNGPAGPTRVVKLHIEHVTGSTELVMDADFGSKMAKALLAASTGLQIAK